jgi:hypothetical protein
MGTGETGFDDVTFDLDQDSQRAHRCHEHLARLSDTDNTSFDV